MKFQTQYNLSILCCLYYCRRSRLMSGNSYCGSNAPLGGCCTCTPPLAPSAPHRMPSRPPTAGRRVVATRGRPDAYFLVRPPLPKPTDTQHRPKRRPRQTNHMALPVAHINDVYESNVVVTHIWGSNPTPVPRSLLRSHCTCTYISLRMFFLLFHVISYNKMQPKIKPDLKLTKEKGKRNPPFAKYIQIAKS